MCYYLNVHFQDQTVKLFVFQRNVVTNFIFSIPCLVVQRKLCAFFGWNRGEGKKIYDYFSVHIQTVLQIFRNIWRCIIRISQGLYVLLTVQPCIIFCKQNQLGAQIFLICLLLFSTCFGQLCAHHQEKIRYLCIPDSHLYRVKNTRCRIGTVFSPDDGHIVARNM